MPSPALVNYGLIKRAIVSLTGLGAVDGSLLRDLAYVLGGEEETDELVEEFLSNSRAALQSITSADGGLRDQPTESSCNVYSNICTAKLQLMPLTKLL